MGAARVLRAVRKIVPMFIVASLLAAVAPVTKAGPGAPLVPDLTTRALPTTSAGIRVQTVGPTKQLAFSNGWENHGAGPFEVAPSGDPALDDCNGNGNPSDDATIKQNIYRDADGNGVFDRAIDTSVNTQSAGCMAWDGSHNHFHVEQMGTYTLLRETDGTVVDTTSKVTFCLVDYGAFNTSLAGAPATQYYASCEAGYQGISVGWYDEYYYGLNGQQLDLTGEPEGDYCLRSTADGGSRFVEEDETNNTVEQRYHIDPNTNAVTAISGACGSGGGGGGGGVENDDFDSAQVVSTGSTTGTTEGATKETGEPEHAENAGGSSVWFSWSPSEDGNTTIDTCDSAFDTLLGVYTGSSVTSLTEVESNDDALPQCSSGQFQSRVSFFASSANVYMIAIDGWGGDFGAYQLTITQASGPPANDDFADAQLLAASPGTVDGTNLDATKEMGEPDHGSNTGGASVWFAWTPSATVPAAIQTCGSSFDTLLGVYTGGPVSVLSPVAANDDSDECGTQSRVTFDADAGVTYYIAVDGKSVAMADPAQGTISLQIGVAAPENDDFNDATAIPSAGGTITGWNIGASTEVGEPQIAGNIGGSSVWFAWAAPNATPMHLSLCGSGYDTLLGVFQGMSLEDLEEVTSNDDDAELCGAMATNRSAIIFQPVPGQTYFIAVDGFNGEEGPITLELARQPQLTIGDVVAKEGRKGQKQFSFAVTLDGASPFVVGTSYRTVDGTAKAPKDYIHTEGALEIVPGEVSGAIVVLINGDRRVERSERFTVELIGVFGANAVKGVGIGKIKNDDR